MADGLFAEHGLDVELVESAPGAERVRLLAGGAGDFLLTASLYHVQAMAGSGPLPVHAVGVMHRRNPIAALVPAGSGIVTPSDLAGRRMGAPVGAQMGWLAVELQGWLRAAGLDQPEVVDMTYPQAYAAMARNEIDFVANLADLLPIDQRRAGIPLRAVPVATDAEAYISVVLAHDAVPDEIVERFTGAATAAFERQRRHPRLGLEALVARYPEVDADVAADTWRRLEQYAFAGGRRPVGGMDRDGWARTLGWMAQTHGLPAVTVDAVVRPGLLDARTVLSQRV